MFYIDDAFDDAFIVTTIGIMASLRKRTTSRYWFACYTDAAGIQRQRSTKMTERAKAQKVADAYEAIYKRKQTEAQVRRAMADIFEEIHEQPLSSVTLGQWFNDWLARIKPEVDPNTYEAYEDSVDLARKVDANLSAKAKESGERYQPICETILDRLDTRQFVALRNGILDIRGAGTTNHRMKIIRMCIKAAWLEGLIPDNPAARVANVKRPKNEESDDRRPFTAEELASVLKAANDEWRGMIYAGLYTGGQRLSDIATLTAGQVDIEGKTVRFAADKTGRRVVLPIVQAWLDDIAPRVKGKPPGSYLFPAARERFVKAKNKTSLVSNSFRRILARVGLATNPNHKVEGAKEGRRKTYPLSFHSLRHTATSMLKSAGVSDSVVMDIVGHESEAVSRNYTHIDDATKRAALEKLPVI